MVELLLKSLIASGPLGIVLAVMLWDNIKTKEKLFKIIENNTSALQKVADSMFDIKKKLEKLETQQKELQD